MIVVTGAAGFIGSCMVARLNEAGLYRDVIVVDDFYKDRKDNNLRGKFIREWVHRDIFLNWFEQVPGLIKSVIHLGARTDTTEQDKTIFDSLNVDYSKNLWNLCTKYNIPFIYASSAATYGDGNMGYSDDHRVVPSLKPLNPYGDSKQEFDQWVLKQKETPPFWAGIKFFNVYGPNEYHKGRMASVVYHAFQQIRQTGAMKLFRSHRPDFKDGEQQRDFIYVKDVVDVLFYLLTAKPASAIYNLGTGKARSFLDLTNATFKSLGLEPQISFIDTPADIRDTYQYFTEADMGKLVKSGYDKPFTSLEDGVADYVKHYLTAGKYY
ncbi:MAG: ADP-glyceromanno-heptose 6-epimerase [Saprospiraceae bacterium]|jgi:ADP-L-glycero-D-manno-heptose 6-epimerase|nr:ADP-glyceromanno-heptose 6-epimerase [Saprospiraceae bacterium]